MPQTQYTTTLPHPPNHSRKISRTNQQQDNLQLFPHQNQNAQNMILFYFP